MNPNIIESHKQTINKTIKSFQVQKQNMKEAICEKVLELSKTIKHYQAEIDQIDAFIEQYFQKQKNDVKMKFEKTGFNSENHKNIQACIESYTQFLEKVEKILDESNNEMM